MDCDLSRLQDQPLGPSSHLHGPHSRTGPESCNSRYPLADDAHSSRSTSLPGSLAGWRNYKADDNSSEDHDDLPEFITMIG
jgi:hypothetical protein